MTGVSLAVDKCSEKNVFTIISIYFRQEMYSVSLKGDFFNQSFHEKNGGTETSVYTYFDQKCIQ